MVGSLTLMSKIINKTPHIVNLITKDKKIVSIPPTGEPIRIGEKIQEIGEIDGLPVVKKTLTEIPPEQIAEIRRYIREGKIVLVSLPVATKLKEVLTKEELSRVAVIGRSVRDEHGRVVGADALALASSL